MHSFYAHIMNMHLMTARSELDNVQVVIITNVVAFHIFYATTESPVVRKRLVLGFDERPDVDEIHDEAEIHPNFMQVTQKRSIFVVASIKFKRHALWFYRLSNFSVRSREQQFW